MPLSALSAAQQMGDYSQDVERDAQDWAEGMQQAEARRASASSTLPHMKSTFGTGPRQTAWQSPTDVIGTGWSQWGASGERIPGAHQFSSTYNFESGSPEPVAQSLSAKNFGSRSE